MKKNDSEVIDVYNDEQMRAAGFPRPHLQQPRDPYVWKKTAKDRKLLRRYRCKMMDGHFHTIPEKVTIAQGKLIVQLKRNKVFPKNTYSFKCVESDVKYLLKKFPSEIICKYYWNVSL